MAKMACGGRFGAFGGGIDRNGVRIRIRRAKKPPGGGEGRVSFDGRERACHLVSSANSRSGCSFIVLCTHVRRRASGDGSEL